MMEVRLGLVTGLESLSDNGVDDTVIKIESPIIRFKGTITMLLYILILKLDDFKDALCSMFNFQNHQLNLRLL